MGGNILFLYLSKLPWGQVNKELNKGIVSSLFSKDAPLIAFLFFLYLTHNSYEKRDVSVWSLRNVFLEHSAPTSLRVLTPLHLMWGSTLLSHHLLACIRTASAPQYPSFTHPPAPFDRRPTSAVSCHILWDTGGLVKNHSYHCARHHIASGIQVEHWWWNALLNHVQFSWVILLALVGDLSHFQATTQSEIHKQHE